MIFDGKAFAKEIEATLRLQLRSGVRVPKIVSIVVGGEPASALYTRLKQAAAERIGINFEIIKIDSEKLQLASLSNVIKEIGEREDVTGVMVQLPIPGVSRKDTEEIIRAIPLEKDVDGLRWEESKVKPATVKAVLSIVDSIAKDKTKFVVLGSRGAVGRPLVHFLREAGVEVSEIEWDTPNPSGRLPEGQVVISCVGKAGLVTGEMVKEGVIAIDVGMSEVGGRVVGDMTNEVYQKASLAVPVPGGVGPVTIASLMQNSVDLLELRKD